MLTSRGAAAIRSGPLLDDDEEVVSIADAPVYRRALTLEFLDHEMKRLQHLNTRFSVLMANYATSATRQGEANSLAQWLIRLRRCLREIDLIGQLGDAVYVVILPQTNRREAETLRQSIVAELGPQSPITLSAVEITEPRQLAQVLAPFKA